MTLIRRFLAAAFVAVGIGAANVNEKGVSFTPDATAQGCNGQNCGNQPPRPQPQAPVPVAQQPAQAIATTGPVNVQQGAPTASAVANNNNMIRYQAPIPVPNVFAGSPPSGGFCTSGWTLSIVGPFAGIGAGRSHPDPECINNISYLEMMRSNDAGTRLMGTLYFLRNNPELRPYADQLIRNFRTACAPEIVQRGVSIALLPTSQELMESRPFNCAEVGWLNTQQVRRQGQRQGQRQVQRQGQPPESCGRITFNAETQTVTVNQHNSCTGNLGSGAAQVPNSLSVPRAN